MKFILFCLIALTCQATAQPSGPIIRSLGDNYFLVQCNAIQLEADDTVTVLRQGQPVATARVMRHEASVCSILLTSGEARRLDLVVLSKSHNAAAERGPCLPTCLLSSPKPPPSPAPKSGGTAGYFNSINTGGSVYNLNTGQYLTTKP